MKIDIEITYLGEDVNVSAGASQMVVAFEFYDGNFPGSSGGGAVDSVNGKTGTVVLGANDINESSTRFWLTDVLKTAYDGAVTWISTNGTNLINHLSNTSNPHNTTASQVGLGNVDNTSDANKPISTATQTALDLKANASDVAIVLFKSITQTIVTGKTAETSIYSIPLPTDGNNYLLKIYSQAQTNTFAGAAISHRIRVGSYVAPIDGAVGADSIGQQTLLAMVSNSSTQSYPIIRNLSLYGGSSGTIFGFPTNSTVNDEVLALQFITLATKDFTTQHYLYVSFNPSNVGAIVQHSQIYITLIKV